MLLVSEAPQAANPALRLPPAAGDGQQGDAEAAAAAARPDLTLQHIKLPQQYIEAAYPAVRGTGGICVPLSMQRGQPLCMQPGV